MSAQTRYGFSAPAGAAGGIVDLAPYAIDTFLNSEDTGVLKFGVGVVQGANPGSNIALPASGATAAKFEGVTVTNRTTEFDVEGKLAIRNGSAVGVMRYGRVYARVKTDVEPKYGDDLYLVIDGDDIGYFTNAADSGNTVAVKGRFMSGKCAGTDVAQIELFNQAQA